MDRLQVAEIVRKNPEQFKACEGCGKVVHANRRFCLCNGYRFSQVHGEVLSAVDELLGLPEEEIWSPRF